MKKFTLAAACLMLFVQTAFAQIDARLFRYPDVSQTHITFSYGGDIWIVPKEGGLATKLSSPAGSESFPKFSVDGSKIAFTGNYDGNTDIYVINTFGGIPKRITYHGMTDRVVDWYPDGNNILFASSRKSGRQRFSQFYKVSDQGGLPERLPLPYAEFGSVSPDGNSIAFTDKSRIFRTWKRYRGGMAADIFTFNFSDLSSERIIENVANDELPMWHGTNIYFISDRGDEKRYNIWKYDMNSKQTAQLTSFTDFDIHFPSIGPEEIVFEAGGKLYLLNLDTEEYKEVEISVVTDKLAIAPTIKSVEDLIQNAWISPDGKRVVVQARGELFSLPAEKGFIKNLTQTTGYAERFPAWSPDGKQIAFWSDESGEYELTLINTENPEQKRKLTSYGPGFRYQLYWSPDSKKLAFIDKAMKIQIYNLDNNTTTQVDQGLWMYQGGLNNFSVSWSPDSRWLAYARGQGNRAGSIFLFDTRNNIKHQVTSGFYSDQNPAFGPEGKYLFFTTNRNYRPIYSDVDNTFIYPNTTKIAAVTLTTDVESPLAAENDDVSTEKKDEENEKGDNNEVKEVNITVNGFERRIVILPAEPGNYGKVHAVKGKVIYHQFPNTGSSSDKSPLKYFDLKEREEKTIIEDVDGFRVASNGDKILIYNKGKLAVINVAEGQKMEKPLSTTEMKMEVDAMAEWKQIFNDTWRFQRDFFYDPNMHGVNWDEMKSRYGNLIDDAITRWDVNFIIGELIAELNASHTYRGGGDTEDSKNLNVGYLGVDYSVENGFYRIARIVRGASWDVEVRSPLDEPGINVNEGDYLIAVNGQRLDTSTDPFAAFQGLAGKTVELTVNSSPSTQGSRKVIVETIRTETRLRHLEWIESNRKRVDEATNGRAGYIYVRSTGFDGQNELVRQFFGQWDKDALIIDERFNSGGQIPDRFIELLNREPLAFWAVRDGKNWQWPPIANFGPKVMLINGWSGSGGDAFPDYFRKAGVGPLIGSRTWGGLIGITGAPSLIDGGGVTVPTFRMYDPDGDWFLEGHGVDPDIEVKENPGQLAQGTDPQLERAIQEIMKLLEEQDFKFPQQPPYQTR